MNKKKRLKGRAAGLAGDALGALQRAPHAQVCTLNPTPDLDWTLDPTPGLAWTLNP
jgi:hypothetical protein